VDWFYFHAYRIAYVGYIVHLMHVGKYADGIWISFLQNMSIQPILFILEFYYYRNHLRKMEALPKLPLAYDLDFILLVFPLLPYGLNYALLDLPHLLQLLTSPSSVNNFWLISFQTIYFSFHYVHMTFQGFFVLRFLSVKDKEGLRA